MATFLLSVEPQGTVDDVFRIKTSLKKRLQYKKSLLSMEFLVILVMNISNYFAFMCFLICPTTDSFFLTRIHVLFSILCARTHQKGSLLRSRTAFSVEFLSLVLSRGYIIANAFWMEKSEKSSKNANEAILELSLLRERSIQGLVNHLKVCIPGDQIS